MNPLLAALRKPFRSLTAAEKAAKEAGSKRSNPPDPPEPDNPAETQVESRLHRTL